MTTTAATIPAVSETLCAKCGYVLSGLPADSRCPECGTPIADSDPALRGLPQWERKPSPGAFLETTTAILLHPTRFFHSFATRVDRQKSRWFAAIQWMLASVFFAIAAKLHLHYTEYYVGALQPWILPVITIATFAALAATNWLASLLTHWEGSYRGLRLPTSAVRRAMDYHAAHYLPIAIIAALTVWVFTTLSDANKLSTHLTMDYFYVLSGEVIVAAAYLFNRYWVAMRNIMYANA